jgi:hypothetical protein
LFTDEKSNGAGLTDPGHEVERLKALRRAAATRDQQRCISHVRMPTQDDGSDRGAAGMADQNHPPGLIPLLQSSDGHRHGVRHFGCEVVAARLASFTIGAVPGVIRVAGTQESCGNDVMHVRMCAQPRAHSVRHGGRVEALSQGLCERVLITWRWDEQVRAGR